MCIWVGMWVVKGRYSCMGRGGKGKQRRILNSKGRAKRLQKKLLQRALPRAATLGLNICHY